MFGGSTHRLSFSGSLDNNSSDRVGSSTPRLRKRSSVVEEEYFPSLLTSEPTSASASASAEKNKEAANDDESQDKSNASSHRRGIFNGGLNSISSPFDFDRRRSYQRASGYNRPKTLSSPAPEEEDHFFDENVPPPTTSLSQASSLLFDDAFSSTIAANDGFSAMEEPHPPRRTDRSSFSGFPNSREEEWAKDNLYWVTVYGFSSSTKAYLLHLFQSFGDVLQFVDGNGNWIHLRYHTRLQAEKALSYDGKMLADGNIMIGVKHCFASEIEHQKLSSSQGLFSSSTCLPSRSSSSAFAAPGSSDLEVDPLDASDLMLPPRRRQDVCSRVMRFLFNWS